VLAARPVARIAFATDGRRAVFMICDRLLVTNHHVSVSTALASSFVVEFDYELGSTTSSSSRRFELAPDQFQIRRPENKRPIRLVSDRGGRSAQLGPNHLVAAIGDSVNRRTLPGHPTKRSSQRAAPWAQAEARQRNSRQSRRLR
jgi:hypothetical protein